LANQLQDLRNVDYGHEAKAAAYESSDEDEVSDVYVAY